MRNATIENLLLSWGGLALLCLAVPVGIGLTEMVIAPLEHRAVAGGRIVVREAAEALVKPLLLDDKLTVQDRLLRTSRVCPEFLYLCVISGPPYPGRRIACQGRCPTFSGRFPASDLADVTRIRTSAGEVLDIRADILDGQLGQVHLGLSRSSLDRAENRAAWFLSASFGLALLCLFVGMQIVTRRVSAPLRRLEETVARYPDSSSPFPGTGITGTPEIESLVAHFRAMTERIERLEAERTATQQQMLHAERLAALGELSAGLVHELRNPVDGMLECVSYLGEAPGSASRVGKYLPLLHEGLERISRTLNGMLGFVRSGEELKLGVCQVRTVLEELAPLVQSKFQRHGVELSIQTCAQCSCYCSVDVLVQVCLNLILNALDALDGVFKPKIRVHAACDKAWVHLYIEDNGPGVPVDIRDKVFAPFFTTKARGHGTGLGLPVSRELVRAAGGDIVLLDEPGQLGGACFCLKLVRRDSSHDSPSEVHADV